MSTAVVTGVAIGIMVLVNGVVGASLLRTALRTRRAPELLIGAGLFGLGPVSQGLNALAGTGRLPAGDVDLVLLALACAGCSVGIGSVFGFVLRVFRPGVAWARALTALAVATLVVANGGSFVSIATARPELPSAEAVYGWGVAILVAFTLAFGWAALEAGGYWLRARKQLRVGLIDPIVVNRFLLWTVASGSAFLLGAWLLLLQVDHEPLSGSLVPSVAIMAISLVTAATMYLAFLPPRSYLAWLQRRMGVVAASQLR